MTDGTTAISFAYNADGQRISKTVDGVTYNYVYVGSTLTDVTWGNNTLHFVYDALGAAAVVYNGTTYYYLRNAQGDIVGIVDTSGNTVVSYAYDAWGNNLSTTGSMAATLGVYNPLRYRGYFYDTETGLYYLTSRYYNPTWGRFINADTTAVLTASPDKANWDKNLFAYCDNNPVSRKDDGGKIWNVIIGAAVGAAAGLVGQLASDLITSAISGKWTFSNWQTYVGAVVGGAVGGAILGGTGNVALANAATGALTTGIGQSLEKLTISDYDKSWAEIGINAVADGAISFGLGKLPGVNSITSGRNSMSAVYRSGLTKIRNQTVVKMSAKVIAKGLVSSVVSGAALDTYYGIKQFAYQPIKRLLLR